MDYINYMMITRRTAFLGLSGLLATPAIVHASSLMKLPMPRKPDWTSYWMSPAGLAPDMMNTDNLATWRQFQPDEVAQQIMGVQPIDPEPFFDLYRLVQPSPQYPNGRSIEIVLPKTEKRLGKPNQVIAGELIESLGNLYELTRPTIEMPYGYAVEVRLRPKTTGNFYLSGGNVPKSDV